MEFEAQYTNLSPSQFIPSRKNFFKPNLDMNNTKMDSGLFGSGVVDCIQEMNHLYNTTTTTTQMDSGLVLPVMAETQTTLFPCYQSFVSDPVSGKNSLNTDSGLTCNFPASRKRPRDSMNELNTFVPSHKARISPLSSILDQDTSSQMQLQQSEIDLFIAQHTKKLRAEIAEQRKHQTRMLISTIREAIVKKLNEKDEAIQRIAKLNWDLQERVKSLYRDNELWKNLAQTSEAKVNSLRTNLEHVLAQAGNENACGGAAAAVEDDAESRCGSNDYGRENEVATGGDSGDVNRMCKMCGVKESSVMLLPCRHLCLCTMCGSTMQTCRVCKSFTSASVHVNMS